MIEFLKLVLKALREDKWTEDTITPDKEDNSSEDTLDDEKEYTEQIDITVDTMPTKIIQCYDLRIRPNFFLSEFMNSLSNNQFWTCDWNRFNMLLDALQHIRDLYGRVVITSAYRSPEFNDNLKGASKSSFHKKGIAVDIKFDFSNTSKQELINLFVSLGMTNIGFYWEDLENQSGLNRVHIDLGKPWNNEEYYVFDKTA